MKIGPKYIGKITYKSLRDFILDEELTENDSIKLNSLNFDDLILEFREFYNESFKEPIAILGININEDSQTPKDRVFAEKKASR